MCGGPRLARGTLSWGWRQPEGSALGCPWAEVSDTLQENPTKQAVWGWGEPQLSPETPFQNFTGAPLGAPKSQVGEGVEFSPPFHSKAFLHMTQTSLNFAKLQSLPMAQPQSGRENVKKEKKEWQPVKHCVVAP